MTTDATRQLAKARGLAYLEYAKKYFEQGDRNNAESAVREGLRLTAGPFYLAVRDQLEEFLALVRTDRIPPTHL